MIHLNISTGDPKADTLGAAILTPEHLPVNLEPRDAVRFRMTLAQAEQLRRVLDREIAEELALAAAAAELGIDLPELSAS